MADPVNTSPEEIALIVGKADWYANVDARAGLAHYLAESWPAIRAALTRHAQQPASPDPVERVARAILSGHNWANGDCTPRGFDEMTPDWQNAYRNMARAAIEAIGIPAQQQPSQIVSPEMRQAIQRGCDAVNQELEDRRRLAQCARIPKPPDALNDADMKLATDWYTWGFQSGMDAAREVSPLTSTERAQTPDEAAGAMANCPYWNGEKSLTSTNSEVCPVCVGSGYSAHPDSGEVCQACKGQGSTEWPEPIPFPSVEAAKAYVEDSFTRPDGQEAIAKRWLDDPEVKAATHTSHDTRSPTTQLPTKGEPQ